jgi:virginiamycin A acetyltransferase
MNRVSTFPLYNFEKWGEAVPSMRQFPVKGDTVIGSDVWTGQDAVILPGVKIGDGAIVGTKSVVGSDVEPYTIAAGNPARLICKRFDDELIELLLKLKWWDLPVTDIIRLIPLLHDNNLEPVKAELRAMGL